MSARESGTIDHGIDPTPLNGHDEGMSKSDDGCKSVLRTASVAQSVERRLVVPDVAGSNPVPRPSFEAYSLTPR